VCEPQSFQALHHHEYPTPDMLNGLKSENDTVRSTLMDLESACVEQLLVRFAFCAAHGRVHASHSDARGRRRLRMPSRFRIENSSHRCWTISSRFSAQWRIVRIVSTMPSSTLRNSGSSRPKKEILMLSAMSSQPYVCHVCSSAGVFDCPRLIHAGAHHSHSWRLTETVCSGTSRAHTIHTWESCWHSYVRFVLRGLAAFPAFGTSSSWAFEQEDECREKTNKRFANALGGAREKHRRRNRDRIVEIQHVYNQSLRGIQETLEELFGDEED